MIPLDVCRVIGDGIRNSKVDQMYDREVFVDHDIVGLNVAMNDAVFMYVF